MSTQPETRVTKKLRPGDPGTLKLLERYGPELICVRYRENLEGTQRLTTVELIIDTRNTRRPTPAKRPRYRNDDIVHLRIGFNESELQKQLRNFGARWTPSTRSWATQWLIVKHLKLTDRIIQTP